MQSPQAPGWGEGFQLRISFALQHRFEQGCAQKISNPGQAVQPRRRHHRARRCLRLGADSAGRASCSTPYGSGGAFGQGGGQKVSALLSVMETFEGLMLRLAADAAFQASSSTGGALPAKGAVGSRQCELVLPTGQTRGHSTLGTGRQRETG